MNYYIDRLKKNRVLKLTLILIAVFFSVLMYFQGAKAEDCQCSDWQCSYDCDDAYGGCATTCWCNDISYDCEDPEEDPDAPDCPPGQTCVSCAPGSYPCNRGCCPYDVPPPDDPAPGDCDPNVWGACTVTCGGGSQINECNNTRACNEQACCTPSCGNTICGDTGAAPNKVTALQVNGALSGNLDLTSSSNLNAVWIDPGTSDPYGAGTTTDYYLQIWDKAQGTFPPGTCNEDSNCIRYKIEGNIENYIAIANADHDNDVYVAVRAVNETCPSVGFGDWSDSSSYNLVADVSGNFYKDQDPTYIGFSNRCTIDANSSLTNLSSYSESSIVSSTGGTPGSLDTSYSISNVPYAPNSSWARSYGFDISLSIGEPSDLSDSITCSCPVGSDPFECELTDNASPSTGNNIFLVDINLANGPWWQTMGGLVYSKEIFATLIPDTCETDVLCNANIITQNQDSDANSAGIPLTGVSSISSGGYFTQRTSLEPRAVNTDHNNLIKENYAYFSRGVDLSLADTISGTITELLPILLATPDSDDTEVYYSNGDLTIDLSSTQNIPSNRKIVIFVDGDLTFSSTPDTQMIDVAQGGFIGFVASGSITFDASVGNSSATSTNPNIAGVFIANGTININGYSDTSPYDDTQKDNKFVGEGTFVGWTGFNLNRDYENTTNPLQKELNNTNPIELFIFRPDFNLNIPAIMMQPSLVWQEVN